MTDQFTADRERIAGEMNREHGPSYWDAHDFFLLGHAVRAFEVLCEPRWKWMRQEHGTWYAFEQKKGRRRFQCVSATGNHAADVCRLVCEVLDREKKEGGR